MTGSASVLAAVLILSSAPIARLRTAYGPADDTSGQVGVDRDRGPAGVVSDRRRTDADDPTWQL